jgi:hypothetical protein
MACSSHNCVPSAQKIFGYAGTTNSGTFIADQITGGLFTCPDNGVPSSITASVYAFASGFKAKAAIYSSSGNLIATTEEKTVTYPTAGLITFNLIGPPVQLTAGSDYYLTVWSQSGSSTAVNSLWTGGNEVEGASASYGTFPSAVSFATVQAGHVPLIYCNYTMV